MNHRFLKYIASLCLPAAIALLPVTVPLTAGAAATEPGTGLKAPAGRVLETMDSGGYTYVNLETETGPVWVALPETSVTAGDELSCLPGLEMKDFHSKTLKRTFERVVFSPGIEGSAPMKPQRLVAATGPAPSDDSFEAAVRAETGSAAPQASPEQVSGGSGGAVAPFAEIRVEKAAGDNSYTVAELFDRAPELAGQTVRVRGQLVKYNPNIMGRNWLHIQDGTGDPMQNTHDLVVTTTEDVGSPQVVTIEGTLAADKDFGAGYRYSVIIENGTVVK